MYGGPSSMDTFEYKPELQKRDGQEIDIEIRRGEIKKQKYIYYHCTGYAEKCQGEPAVCRRKYLREEILEQQQGEIDEREIARRVLQKKIKSFAREADQKKRRDKSLVDKISAVLILQEYLESKRENL